MRRIVADALIAALGLVAVALFVLDEDTEATMFGLAAVGLLVGRRLGIADGPLLALTVTTGFLVTVVLAGVLPSKAASTVAHAVIGAFLAWGLAEPIWARLGMYEGVGRRVAAVVAVVLVLAAGWEVGEQLIDRLIGTAIELSFLATAFDLFVGAAGAAIGALAAVCNAPPGSFSAAGGGGAPAGRVSRSP